MDEVRRSQADLQYRRLIAQRNATLPRQFDIVNEEEVAFARGLRQGNNDVV